MALTSLARVSMIRFKLVASKSLKNGLTKISNGSIKITLKIKLSSQMSIKCYLANLSKKTRKRKIEGLRYNKRKKKPRILKILKEEWIKTLKMNIQSHKILNPAKPVYKKTQ
jgi:predicted membrane metal-binding protein